jgi:hypothetical protein
VRVGVGVGVGAGVGVGVGVGVGAGVCMDTIFSFGMEITMSVSLLFSVLRNSVWCVSTKITLPSNSTVERIVVCATTCEFGR